MVPELDEQERQALAAEAQPLAESVERVAKQVAQRDFQQPLRLSAARKHELLELGRAALPLASRALAAVLGGSQPELELLDLREGLAEQLGAALTTPLTALRFDCASQPCWIAWQNPAAVSAIESLLGGARDVPAEGRSLSAIERGLLQRLLSAVAKGLTDGLRQPASGYALIDAFEAPSGNQHRLAYHLAWAGPGGPSTFHVYLPAPPESASAPSAPARIPLPRHLSAIEVQLAARFEIAQVPLAQLLALEPGDVIPLDAPTSHPLELCVDGHPFARALLGQRAGRLAARIAAVPMAQAGQATHAVQPQSPKSDS